MTRSDPQEEQNMQQTQRVKALAKAFGWALGYLVLGKILALVLLPETQLLFFVHRCVTAPVVEELVFRGAIQSALQPLGGVAAVWVQAALFAVQHSGAAGMLYALAMGAVLGQLRQKSGSCLPGMLLHALNNLLVFAAG